jgi:hypothetical protein
LRDEGYWRFTGAFGPDKTLAGDSPALPGKNTTGLRYPNRYASYSDKKREKGNGELRLFKPAGNLIDYDERY